MGRFGYRAWAAALLVALATAAAGPAAPVFVVTGKGYGHGVGLSQYGAEGAARQGLSAQKIVRFYYPHTQAGTVRGSGVSAGGNWTIVLSVADGPHTYAARAIDAAGNRTGLSGERAIIVDTTAPNTTLSGGDGPVNDSTPTYTLTSTETGSTFACSVDACDVSVNVGRSSMLARSTAGLQNACGGSSIGRSMSPRSCS